MNLERRREERLILRGVSLWIRHNDRAIICEVLNLSRLGVGLKIPEDAITKEVLIALNDTKLDCTLKIGEVTVQLGLAVIRASGLQLGCSFVFPNEESQKKVFEALSPRFVAQSLVKVGRKNLNNHLKYAYFGNDFFVIAHAEIEKYQISAAGYDVNIEEDNVDVIANGSSYEAVLDGDYAKTYSFLPRPKLSKRDAIDWVISVLEVWESPPEDLSVVLAKLRACHAA